MYDVWLNIETVTKDKQNTVQGNFVSVKKLFELLNILKHNWTLIFPVGYVLCTHHFEKSRLSAGRVEDTLTSLVSSYCIGGFWVCKLGCTFLGKQYEIKLK